MARYSVNRWSRETTGQTSAFPHCEARIGFCCAHPYCRRLRARRGVRNRAAPCLLRTAAQAAFAASQHCLKDPQKSVGQCWLAANRKEQAKTTPIFLLPSAAGIGLRAFYRLSGQCRLMLFVYRWQQCRRFSSLCLFSASTTPLRFSGRKMRLLAIS